MRREAATVSRQTDFQAQEKNPKVAGYVSTKTQIFVPLRHKKLSDKIGWN
jgi:hypothetical protein